MNTVMRETGIGKSNSLHMHLKICLHIHRFMHAFIDLSTPLQISLHI